MVTFLIKLIKTKKKEKLLCINGCDTGFGNKYEDTIIKISKHNKKINLIKNTKHSKKIPTGEIINSMQCWFLVDEKKYYLDIIEKYDYCDWFNIYVGEYDTSCSDNMCDKALYRYNYKDYETLQENDFKDILADYLG